MNPKSEETTVGPALLAPYGSPAFLPLAAKVGIPPLDPPDDGKGVRQDQAADRPQRVVRRLRPAG
jgi:hypothetical protein